MEYLLAAKRRNKTKDIETAKALIAWDHYQ